MQASILETPSILRSRAFWLALAALALLLVSILSIVKPFHAPSTPPVALLSQADLEGRYGLRVTLIAVTAAGGMVDVRLKMVDAAKVQALLQDRANFPALRVGERGVTLNASADVRSGEINFENNADLFLLFPNSGNAVKPGTQVYLMFGNIAVEPIKVRE